MRRVTPTAADQRDRNKEGELFWSCERLFRFGSSADIHTLIGHVRFSAETRHRDAIVRTSAKCHYRT